VNCPSCGNKLLTNAAFCSQCGVSHALLPVDPQEATRTMAAYFGNELSDAGYDVLVHRAQIGSTIQLVALFTGFGLYLVLMETSPLEGTLGKRLLGIRVADLNGRRLTLGRATARHLARWLAAGMWQAGFLMAAFTARKQRFHDILAGTVVLARTYRGGGLHEAELAPAPVRTNP
jgi:uncharacterized RDD family membrane protein YckC